MASTVTIQASKSAIQGDSAEKLISDLDATSTLPLWAQMAKLNPPLPNPRCVPNIWKYDEIKPYLLRAGDLITEKQAERRVLMLVNPGRGTALIECTILRLTRLLLKRPHILPTRSMLAFN